MKSKKSKTTIGQIVLHVVFLVLVLLYVLPFMLTISISLSDETSLVTKGYSLFPVDFSTEAYKAVFRNPIQILRSYAVTISFSVISTALSIVIMALLAYSLSRPNYRYKRALSFYVFFTMLFSGGLVPTYLLNVRYLHLDNNFLIYILPGLVSAYNVMIVRSYYRSVPYELVEAAKVDGAKEFFICFRIMMPLSMPVLASVGFLYFVAKWNNWMTSLLYIENPDLYSLQYLLQRVLQESEYLKQLAQEGTLFGEALFPAESFRYAMALVVAGPVLVIFPFFQKHLSRGLTLGGVKG